MQFYLFIAFLFPILVTRKAGSRCVFILVLLVTSFISLACDDKWIKLSLPFHIPVFLMGYFLFLRKTCRINSGEFFLGITICTVCCAMLTGYYHELGYRISLVAGLTSIIVAYSKEGLQWLSSIGQYSYSPYLFHWLFISPMAHYVRPYFSRVFGAIELYVLLILLCVGGSRLFYIIIEKPSFSWAKKFGSKKTIAN